MDALVPIIDGIRARSEGPISEMDPAAVIGLMGSSLGWLIMHEGDYTAYEDSFESIEDGYYDETRELLISTLARGLTVPE